MNFEQLPSLFEDNFDLFQTKDSQQIKPNPFDDIFLFDQKPIDEENFLNTSTKKINNNQNFEFNFQPFETENIKTKQFQENPQTPMVEMISQNNHSSIQNYETEKIPQMPIINTYEISNPRKISKEFSFEETNDTSSLTSSLKDDYSLEKISNSTDDSYIPKAIAKTSKKIKKKRGRKKKQNVLVRYKKLIDSGKAQELVDPKFPTYSAAKKKKILQMVRNRISAQNSRQRKRNQFNEISTKNEKLVTENDKLKQIIEQLKKENGKLVQEKEVLAKKSIEIPNSFNCNSCRANNDMKSSIFDCEENLMEDEKCESLFSETSKDLWDCPLRSKEELLLNYQVKSNSTNYKFGFPLLALMLILAVFFAPSTFNSKSSQVSTQGNPMDFSISLYRNENGGESFSNDFGQVEYNAILADVTNPNCTGKTRFTKLKIQDQKEGQVDLPKSNSIEEELSPKPNLEKKFQS